MALKFIFKQRGKIVDSHTGLQDLGCLLQLVMSYLKDQERVSDMMGRRIYFQKNAGSLLILFLERLLQMNDPLSYLVLLHDEIKIVI